MQPRLECIYVASDGSIKACYEDNTLLVLSAAAESFTHISPAGVKTVQLCEFCLRRFAPLLCELLDFRNQHVDIPVFCKPLKQQLAKAGQLFSQGYPIADVCWPATPEEAFQQGLVELPDRHRVAVLSCCSSARIVLEYTGLRFAVCYPLLVDYEPSSNSYTHTWQTQVFSRCQYPQRWQPALAVACAVAENAAHGFKLHPPPHLQQQYQQYQQQQQWQQRQALANITNRPDSSIAQQAGGRLSAGGCWSSSSSPAHFAGSPPRQGSPKRFGSPLQRQHRAWQQQDYYHQNQQQQQQPQLFQSPVSSPTRSCRYDSPSRYGQSPPRSAALALAGAADARGVDAHAYQAAAAGSAAFITQLPINSELQQRLPTYLQKHHQQQQQQLALHSTNSSSQLQQQQQQSLAAAAGGGSKAANSSGRIAAAVAQALGQRQHPAGSAAAAAGLGRGWWLEPSLLLPADELLQMIWTREATMLFVQEVEEVEVWLHADDSCLYSFQGGAFVTHLLPVAAAAAWDTRAATAAATAAANDSACHVPIYRQEATSSWHKSSAAAAAAAAVDGNGQLSLCSAAATETPTPQLAPTGDSAAVTDSAAPAVGDCRGVVLGGGGGGDDTVGLVEGTIDASNMSRVYAASALPEMPVTAVAAAAAAGAAAGGSSVVVKLPIGQVAAQALKFRSTMVRVQRYLQTCAVTAAGPAGLQPPTSSQYLGLPGSTPQLQLQQQGSSSDVVEEQDVPGVGRFIATADGHIRVLFADRTILNMAAAAAAAAGGGSASLVLADGSRRQVTTHNPIGVEQYVQAALEFAAWAATSPADRAAALRTQALVAAELRSSARMAAICEWGSAQRVPAAAATAAAADQAALAAETAAAAAAAAVWDDALDASEQDEQDERGLAGFGGYGSGGFMAQGLAGVEGEETSAGWQQYRSSSGTGLTEGEASHQQWQRQRWRPQQQQQPQDGDYDGGQLGVGALVYDAADVYSDGGAAVLDAWGLSELAAELPGASCRAATRQQQYHHQQQQWPLYRGSSSAGGCGSALGGGVAPMVVSRQVAVEEMLQANARLLERLKG